MRDHFATPPTPPRPAGTTEPWDYLGISQSAFYRLLSADLAPLPMTIPGCRQVWRVADLDRRLASQRVGRKPRKSRKATS